MKAIKEKPDRFYAHSLEGQPPAKWQLLEEHLKQLDGCIMLLFNYIKRRLL